MSLTIRVVMFVLFICALLYIGFVAGVDFGGCVDLAGRFKTH